MKSYIDFRRKLHKDHELKQLRNLYRALQYGDKDDRHKVAQAMRDREEELFQQYITPKTPADWNKVNDNAKQLRVREQQDCECGSNSHAHSINCPQHPGNLQPPVGWK